VKFILLAIALCFAHSGLFAQEVKPNAMPDAAPEISARPVSFLLGAGLSVGGDTLVTATYTDGTTQSIKGGGLVYLKAGADWRVNPNMSLQGTFGYHADSANGTNGSLRFARTFLEGLAFWDMAPRYRLGAGIRQVSNPKLTSSGVASSVGTVDFKASLGTVLEYEWFFSRHGNRGYGVTVRYVSEKYTPTNFNGAPVTGKDLDGSHLGLGFNAYF
jgi:hypothetical protein